MSPVFGRRCRAVLGRSGTASLEFALVAIPFVFLLLAGMDLGRYFITQHSLRTLISEAARSALVNCSSLGNCSYAQAVPSPSIVWAKVPFLSSALPLASLTASQTIDISSGIRTISVTGKYPFSFILPLWTGIANLNPIIESTTLQY
jgi:uncharacterized membrane protein